MSLQSSGKIQFIDFTVNSIKCVRLCLFVCFFHPYPLSQTLSPFSILRYNWSNNSLDDSLQLRLCAYCILSSAVLQPVTDFHYPPK